VVYKPVILHVGIDLKFLTDLTAVSAAHLPIEIHLTAVGVVSDSAVVLLPFLPPSLLRLHEFSEPAALAELCCALGLHSVT
jgi:hypothetical protein